MCIRDSHPHDRRDADVDIGGGRRPRRHPNPPPRLPAVLRPSAPSADKEFSGSVYPGARHDVRQWPQAAPDADTMRQHQCVSGHGECCTATFVPRGECHHGLVPQLPGQRRLDQRAGYRLGGRGGRAVGSTHGESNHALSGGAAGRDLSSEGIAAPGSSRSNADPDAPMPRRGKLPPSAMETRPDSFSRIFRFAGRNSSVRGPVASPQRVVSDAARNRTSAHPRPRVFPPALLSPPRRGYAFGIEDKPVINVQCCNVADSFGNFVWVITESSRLHIDVSCWSARGESSKEHAALENEVLMVFGECDTC